MNEGKPAISANMVVTLDYTLTLDNGEVADSTQDGMPLRFLAGSGELLPAFEDALMGLAVGDELSVTLSPEDGYGEFDEEAFEEVGIENFPSLEGVEPGTAIEVHDSDGDTYTAFISEVRDDIVVLNYNHPLAGETLHFQVKVLDVRPASAEELDHGHAHGGDGHAH